MTSPGTRLPPNTMGHTGPGGPPPPNPYRPGMPPAMSPSMNQGGPRMFMTNSPGVTTIQIIYALHHFIFLGWRLFIILTSSLWCMYFNRFQLYIFYTFIFI